MTTSVATEEIAEATPDDENEEIRLDHYVAEVLDITRSQAQKHIKSGNVQIAENVITKTGYRVSSELDVVIAPRENSISVDPIPMDLVIVDQDPSQPKPRWVAVDKPAGLVVHPGAGEHAETLVQGLVHAYGPVEGTVTASERPGVVHRLDRGTSGVMLWATDVATQAELSAKFRDRQVYKAYLAWIWGEVKEQKRLDRPIRRSTSDPTRYTCKTRGSRSAGKEAISDLWPIVVEAPTSQYPLGRTLVSVVIYTGRTHQIRVHCAEIERPVIGDHTYNRHSHKAPRMMLHARTLGIIDREQKYIIQSPVPDEFGLDETMVAALAKWEQQIGEPLALQRMTANVES